MGLLVNLLVYQEICNVIAFRWPLLLSSMYCVLLYYGLGICIKYCIIQFFIKFHNSQSRTINTNRSLVVVTVITCDLKGVCVSGNRDTVCN